MGADAGNYQYKYFKGTVPEQRLSIGQSDQRWHFFDFGPKGVAPLVCLGGVASTADVFYKQILALSAKGYRILAVDAPAIWTFESWLSSFDQFLDALKIHQVHLYGTSLGGFLAQLYAQQRPRRVRSLVLSNTFLSTSSFQHAFGPWTPLVSWAPDFVLKRMILSGFREGPHEPQIADAIDFVVAHLETLGRAELASRLALNFREASVLRLPLDDEHITLMDSLDYAAVSNELRDALYKRYPGARRAFLKSGGDFPFLSRADEVSLHLLLHLRRVGAQRAGPDIDTVPVNPQGRWAGLSRSRPAIDEELESETEAGEDDEGVGSEDAVSEEEEGYEEEGYGNRQRARGPLPLPPPLPLGAPEHVRSRSSSDLLDVAAKNDRIARIKEEEVEEEVIDPQEVRKFWGELEKSVPKIGSRVLGQTAAPRSLKPSVSLPAGAAAAEETLSAAEEILSATKEEVEYQDEDVEGAFEEEDIPKFRVGLWGARNKARGTSASLPEQEGLLEGQSQDTDTADPPEDDFAESLRRRTPEELEAAQRQGTNEQGGAGLGERGDSSGPAQAAVSGGAEEAPTYAEDLGRHRISSMTSPLQVPILSTDSSFVERGDEEAWGGHGEDAAGDEQAGTGDFPGVRLSAARLWLQEVEGEGDGDEEPVPLSRPPY